MAIPSLKQFSQEPGGAINYLRDINNTRESNRYLKDINKTKAQYAPQTEKANALSKIAYASIVAPQYMAKIMGNNAFAANMTPEQQKKNARINSSRWTS